MRSVGRLVHLLRNTHVREIIRALECDGFILNGALEPADTSIGTRTADLCRFTIIPVVKR